MQVAKSASPQLASQIAGGLMHARDLKTLVFERDPEFPKQLSKLCAEFDWKFMCHFLKGCRRWLNSAHRASIASRLTIPS
jgi:hypothetical protein